MFILMFISLYKMVTILRLFDIDDDYRMLLLMVTNRHDYSSKLI